MEIEKSVPITTKVVSSNHAHGIVYLIQHYAIKLVSDLLQVGVFFLVFCSNKTYRYDITETQLKVALNTITITLYL